MELLLERKYLKAAYTIGCLSFDGTRFVQMQNTTSYEQRLRHCFAVN